jgi:hypothetical protein
MTTNLYDTASAVLRVANTYGGEARVSDVQRRLSRGQLQHFESALTLLTAQGEVETYPFSPGTRGRVGRGIRVLHPVTPDPHCPTCTCHDVL